MTDSFPILTTSGLLLREFVEADQRNVFTGLSHPDIIRYYGVSYNTYEATKEQMTFFSDLQKNETGIWWALCSPESNVFYGAAGLNNLNKTHKKAEIGFWLLVDHWGKGIITKAIPLIVNYGFDRVGLHRIEAFVETENVNSKRTLEKLNFNHEGTLHECEIKEGKYISLDVYAKLNL